MHLLIIFIISYSLIEIVKKQRGDGSACPHGSYAPVIPTSLLSVRDCNEGVRPGYSENYVQESTLGNPFLISLISKTLVQP